jgi:hypothetical protein
MVKILQVQIVSRRIKLKFQGAVMVSRCLRKRVCRADTGTGGGATDFAGGSI